MLTDIPQRIVPNLQNAEAIPFSGDGDVVWANQMVGGGERAWRRTKHFRFELDACSPTNALPS